MNIPSFFSLDNRYEINVTLFLYYLILSKKQVGFLVNKLFESAMLLAGCKTLNVSIWRSSIETGEAISLHSWFWCLSAVMNDESTQSPRMDPMIATNNLVYFSSSPRHQLRRKAQQFCLYRMRVIRLKFHSVSFFHEQELFTTSCTSIIIIPWWFSCYLIILDFSSFSLFDFLFASYKKRNLHKLFNDYN